MTFILEKVGTRRSLRFINEIEELATNRSNIPTNYSFFDIFLDKVIGEKILTKQEIGQVIKEESKRPSSFIFSIANSYTSKFTLLERSNSPLSSHYNVDNNDNKVKKSPIKTHKVNGRTSVSEIPLEGLSHLHSQDNTTQPSQKDNQNKSNNLYNEFPLRRPLSFKDLVYNGESMNSHDFKHSCEVSNLDNYLSSDEGEASRDYKGSDMLSIGISNKIKGEVLTDELELSPGLQARIRKRSEKKKSTAKLTKPQKVREISQEDVITEEKENNKETSNAKSEVENIPSKNFVVKRKNVFGEGEVY